MKDNPTNPGIAPSCAGPYTRWPCASDTAKISALLVEAIKHQKRVRSANLSDEQCRRDLWNHYFQLALVSLELKDHATASSSLLALPDLSTDRGRGARFAVDGLLDCISIVEKNTAQTSEARDKFIQQYLAQARNLYPEADDWIRRNAGNDPTLKELSRRAASRLGLPIPANAVAPVVAPRPTETNDKTQDDQ